MLDSYSSLKRTLVAKVTLYVDNSMASPWPQKQKQQAGPRVG